MAIKEKQLEKWAQKKDLNKLYKALEEHNFQIRLAAVAHLSDIKDHGSIPHLAKLKDDPFIAVLKSASQAIASMAPNHPDLALFERKIAEKENIEAKLQNRTREKFQRPSQEERAARSKELAKAHNISAEDLKPGYKLQEQKNKTAATAVIVIAILLFVLKWVFRFLN